MSPSDENQPFLEAMFRQIAPLSPGDNPLRRCSGRLHPLNNMLPELNRGLFNSPKHLPLGPTHGTDVRGILFSRVAANRADVVGV